MFIKNVANLLLDFYMKNVTENTNYNISFNVYNFDEKFLIYNNIYNTNDYLEFTEIDDITEYITEYIDTLLERSIDNPDEQISKVHVKILKNNSIFIDRLLNIEDSSEDLDDDLYSIKFSFKKYLVMLSKIDKEYNRKIYEVLFKANDINTKLPIEILIEIVKNVS